MVEKSKIAVHEKKLSEDGDEGWTLPLVLVLSRFFLTHRVPFKLAIIRIKLMIASLKARGLKLHRFFYKYTSRPRLSTDFN